MIYCQGNIRVMKAYTTNSVSFYWESMYKVACAIGDYGR